MNRTSMAIASDAGTFQPAGVYVDDLSFETMYLPPDPPDSGTVNADPRAAGLPDSGVITVRLGFGCGCTQLTAWWAFVPLLVVISRRRP